MRAALVIAALLVTMLLTPIEASAVLDTIDFYHSYAVDGHINVNDIGRSCWLARWSTGIVITSGINATVTGGIPLNYSESLGAWCAEDNHSDVIAVTYSIESAVHENATGFFQSAPNITIIWDRVIVTNTTSTTPTESTDPPDPPFVFPTFQFPIFHFEVLSSSGLAFAGFLAAIITLLWKVNRDE